MRRSRLPSGWKVYEGEPWPEWSGTWFYAEEGSGCGPGGAHYTWGERTRNKAIAALLSHLRELRRWPPWDPPDPELRAARARLLSVIGAKPLSEADAARARFKALFGYWP